MMTFLLRQCANSIRKIQGIGKIRETKDPLQPLDSLTFYQGPVGNLRPKFANLRLSDSRSVAAAGYTLFIRKCAHNSRFMKAYLLGLRDGGEHCRLRMNICSLG
jgi:hypothetical protein